MRLPSVDYRNRFDQPSEPSRRQTQSFEIFGNRAIYHDSWVAGTTPAGTPWDVKPPTVDVITGYTWELYNVAKDFSQANNLADEMPDKLRELRLLFYAEAARNNVLPLDDSRTSRLDPALRPSLTRGQQLFRRAPGRL